jgi:hypothetical protein
MKHNNGEILFDSQLELETPLEQLWQEAHPCDTLSPLRGKRLHEATGLLVRQHPRRHFSEEIDINTTQEAQTIVDTVRTHFEQLQRFGLCVISYATELDPSADFSMDADPNAPVGYSATMYVEHSFQLDEPVIAEGLATKKVQQLVANPIREYMLWCRETGSPYMLSDIHDTSQYAWQQSSGIVFLPDVDPIIDPVPTKAEGWARDLAYIDDQFSNIGKP